MVETADSLVLKALNRLRNRLSSIDRAVVKQFLPALGSPAGRAMSAAALHVTKRRQPPLCTARSWSHSPSRLRTRPLATAGGGCWHDPRPQQADPRSPRKRKPELRPRTAQLRSPPVGTEVKGS